jgi:hypothetical protein
MGGKNGSVVLFLRNLPFNFSRRDLKSFVLSELKKAGIRGTSFRAPCSNWTVLRITDRSKGTQEYHGLVEIRPARIAMQAIAVLNGKAIAGTSIEVHRYRHRSPWGEYLNRHQDDGTSIDDLKRSIEGRRLNIKIDLVDETPRLLAQAVAPVLVS